MIWINKNSHIIIKNCLTHVVLFILTKNPFIKRKFKKMVIEMLLNDDIQVFFWFKWFKTFKRK
jgi:hypothetical protein